MGVATVNFPQGLEFSNFFLRYYRPIRGNWWIKTFVIIFLQVDPKICLTFPYYKAISDDYGSVHSRSLLQRSTNIA